MAQCNDCESYANSYCNKFAKAVDKYDDMCKERAQYEEDKHDAIDIKALLLDPKTRHVVTQKGVDIIARSIRKW